MNQSPLRKALKEARTVVLIGILLAISFNLFASSKVPWIRTTKSVDTISDDALFNDVDTTTIDQPIDTVPAVDSGMSAEELEKHRIDSIKKEEQRVQDSIKNEKKRIQDSTEKAEKANDISNIPVDGAKGITTEQAKKLLDMKAALFIDARRSDQFGKGHIPGALNIYAYDFQDNIGKVAGLPKNKRLVVYCYGGECELSHDLADDLAKFGFTKVVIYTGGWEEWSKTDYPKSTGE